MLLETTAGLRIDELTSIEQLEHLRSEWLDLYHRCARTTPFQLPQWLIPWWKHLGEGQLWTLALRHEGRLVGLAPWFLHMDNQAAARQLLFIGTGNTDYLDVLLDPDWESEGQVAFFQHLEANSTLWDRCDWQQLRGESTLLRAPLAGQWDNHISVQDVCPVLKLPSHLESLSQAVPGHMLEKLRFYWRRAEKLGRVEITRACKGNLRELFCAHVELHRVRWLSRGQPGMLNEERIARFQAEAASEMLANGVLRLSALRLADRPIGTLFALADRRAAFYYLGGFDPEFAPISPGTLLIGDAIEQAIREQLNEFDFLRGCEAYKYRWGAKNRLNYRCQFESSPARTGSEIGTMNLFR